MRIKKFNENINESYYVPFASYDALNTKYENLKNEIIKDIVHFVQNNQDEIVFSMAPSLQDPDGDPGNQVSLIRIDDEMSLVVDTEYDDECKNYGLADFSAEDLLKIIRSINNSTRTYLYQKDIIDKHPYEIPDILKHLNARILKEYPHLASGKDLNLI